MEKIHVAKLFQQYVSHYLPIPEAHCATLGGHGVDACQWFSAHLPPNQGWIIEREPALRRLLKEQLPYRLYSELRSFPVFFRQKEPTALGIDAFHLDLCGTIEANLPDITPIIPLVTASRGRCLAITVADARRNLSLENFPAIEQQWQAWAGCRRFAQILQRLVRQHEQMPCSTNLPVFMARADPKTGAKRELGLLTTIYNLLSQDERPRYGQWSVDNLHRYVYVSDYLRNPFRMRTYFLHLTAVPNHYSILDFVEYWLTSPLMFLRDEQVMKTITESKKEITMPQLPLPTKPERFSRLRAIAQVVGDEALQEYEELFALANTSGQTCQELLNDIKGVLHRYESNSQPGAEAQPAANSYSSDTINYDKVQLQLDLLRARAKGEKTYQQAMKRAATQVGKGTARALFSRTQGKFRRNFVDRAASVFGPAIREELAELYSVIDDRKVSVQDLR